ncbi:lipid II flippase MurJ, partial [Treponema lecithinolyticum]
MKHSLVSAGIKLSLLTLASRILGLVREMTKAAFLGTSALADAFGVAFMIPNLFRRLFAENSISVAFIPTFKAMLEKSGNTGSSTDAVEYEKNIRDFLNAVFTLVGFTASVTVAAGIALAPLIVPLFVRGDASSVLPEMIFLTRIMFPYLLVISVAAFFQGILNSVNVFTPSGF